MQENNRRSSGLIALAALVPAVICLAIAVPMLWIVWPDLNARQIDSVLGGLVLTLGLAGAIGVAALWYWWRGRQLPLGLLLATPPLQFLAFYSYLRWLKELLSQRWLFDDDAYMTLVLSGIIPLFYTTLALLARRFAISDRRSLIVSAAGSVIIPIGIYAMFQLIRYARWGYGADTVAITIVAGLTIVFSFWILRLMFYLVDRKASVLDAPAGRFVLRVVFIGLLPLLGLLMNTTGPVARESRAVLGDFTGKTFWLLALINAMVYLLPRSRHRVANALVVSLRGAGLCYVLYFCIVFLLYLPLAVLLIAAIGLGLLLLIPYFALAIQYLTVREDYRAWSEHDNPRTFFLMFGAGFLLLPAVVLGDLLLERRQLLAAIDYVQHPPLALNHESPGVGHRLATMLQPPPRQNRGWLNDKESVPLYTPLRHQVVFDGIGLSDAMRERLLRVFFGEKRQSGRAANRTPSARIRTIRAATSYDGERSKTELRIRIENADPQRAAELDLKLHLPEYAFLTGHWLVIDGVEQPAQITTRSAAVWTYNRITEQQRDPSLIWFEAKNRLRWKLFPVPAKGYREARLQISHYGAGELVLGERKIRLQGTPAQQDPGHAKATAAKALYLHFIADCSQQGKQDYSAAVANTVQRTQIPLSGARISYVNSAISTVDLPAASQAKCPELKEGFFSDLAFRTLMATTAHAAAGRAPLMVVLSPSAPDAQWDEISYFTRWYTAVDFFLHANETEIRAFDFYGNARQLPDLWAIAPSGPRKAPAAATELEKGQVAFERWLLGEKAARHEAVRDAIETGVLNPATGSIVVETEAQRRKLAEMHKKTLASQHELEIGDRPRMSEPAAWLILLLLLPLVLRPKMRRSG